MGCANGRLLSSSSPTKINTVTYHSVTQTWQYLHDAIVKNDFNNCFHLLESVDKSDLYTGASSESDSSPKTLSLPPLHLACMYRRLEIIILLLRYTSNVSFPDSNGRTPIVMTILYWPKVGPWDRPKNDCLPAAERRLWDKIDVQHDRSMKCLMMLLSLNANPSDTVNTDNATLLHVCAQREIISAMNVLLKFGAKLEIRDIYGHTPLLFAAKLGKIRSIRHLLALNTNWEATDDNKCNILHLLCVRDIEQAHGIKSLFSDFPQLLKLINNISVYGHTPLHLAAQSGNGDIINLLLSKGADPDIKDNFGRTALYMLLKNNKIEFVLTGLFPLLTDTSVLSIRDINGKLPEKMIFSGLKTFKNALIRRSNTPFTLYEICFRKIYRLLGRDRLGSSCVITLPCPHYIKKDIIAYKYVYRNYWESLIFEA